MTISFEDAAFGKETEIRIPKTENCPTCDGTGCKPGTHPKTCSACRGTGQQRVQQGFFTIARTCPACRGEGQSSPTHARSARAIRPSSTRRR